MVTELPDTPVPSWSIVNLVPVPSAAAVTKSLRLEVALYPTNKSTIQGGNNADTLNTNTTKTTLHGLGGNDTLTGGATDDILIGGAEHPRHINYLANIPTANILVKGICATKHQIHISHLTNIPTANVLVKGMCRYL
jgi:hypothetical protein